MGDHADVDRTIQERIGINLKKVGLAISEIRSDMINNEPSFTCVISKLNLKKG
jgi:predicted nicotinamide N-methyase